MVTLRCTQKLLRRLRQPLKQETLPPTTVLGDWYATLIHARPEQRVLCMNERSLLVVVVTARDGKHLPDRFREAALDHLLNIGVPPATVAREALEMRDIRYGPTESRSVLGCMNDVIYSLDHAYERHGTDEAVAMYFAEWLHAPIKSRHPREVALHLFGIVPRRIERLDYFHGVFAGVGLAKASNAQARLSLDGEAIPEHIHRLFARERIAELAGTYGVAVKGQVEVDYLRLTSERRTWEIRVVNRGISMVTGEGDEVRRLHVFFGALWRLAEERRPG